ncbi:MAG: M14 family metallocarboxypeptidase [Clostridia bacterium]|nr:M14 family metallocarboxypeptidase [Clostridia bacterium]
MILHEIEPNYNTQRQTILALEQKYPFMKAKKIGESHVGRDIYTLFVGNMGNPTLFAGGFHALEWLTVSVLLKFTERICSAAYADDAICDVDVPKSLATRGVIIVPCINPDGIEIALSGADSAGEYAQTVLDISGGDLSSWNANARGVDINHNFDAEWEILKQTEQKNGIFSPSPRRFGGYAPESENETKALCELCREFNVRKVMALHSQGEEIYWNFGKKTPRQSRAIGEILAKSSGYSLTAPDEEIATGGGFKDWFINEFAKPGFTVEIGKGKNPLPINKFNDIYKKIEEMLMIFTII